MKFILLISVVVLVLSCDKREDFYKVNNQGVATILSINNPWSSQTALIQPNGLEIFDTLKLGFEYKFSINISDEYNRVNCKFIGDGRMKLNGSYFTEEQVDLGNHSFKWSDTILGDRNFKIVFKDAYDVEKVYQFRITIFENKRPNISWNIVHVGNLSPLHKKFIVDGYDGDHIYGGRILYYQIIVNNDTTNYPNNTMDYVFTNSGFYDIGVRAMDSNHEWSNFPIQNNYHIQ